MWAQREAGEVRTYKNPTAKRLAFTPLFHNKFPERRNRITQSRALLPYIISKERLRLSSIVKQVTPNRDQLKRRENLPAKAENW